MPVGERCVLCGGDGWLGVIGGPDLTYDRGECSRCGGTGRQKRGWFDRALERLGAWLDR